MSTPLGLRLKAQILEAGADLMEKDYGDLARAEDLRAQARQAREEARTLDG